MPPKGPGRSVSKKCPECKKQIAVATRLCGCGHQFFEERRKSTASNASEHDDPDDINNIDNKERIGIDGCKMPLGGIGGSPAVEGKRRSERVKREKPNFYDALEYDNKMKKARKERQKEEQLQTGFARIKRERKIKPQHSEIVNIITEDDDEDELLFKDKKRKKKKKNSICEKKEEEIDEDIMAGITPEKEWQYSMVLSDINLKMGLNNPAFYKLPV